MVVLLFCGVILFGMASCSDNVPEQSETTIETMPINPYQEKSDVEIADDSTGIVLAAAVNSDQVMNLTIKNNSTRHLGYGDLYSLEYAYEGDWYKVPLLPNVAFPMVLYEIDPGKEKTLEIVIGWTHDVLQPGHYRIVKEVSLADAFDDDTDPRMADRYNIAAEFDISDPAITNS
ncbi:MAG: hypothetical protein J5715_07090 [Clostridiales bacterium]|nr:hypothetical protein [Clostridiales bacterium]